MDCLFCAIAENKVPAYVVYTDEHTLGILDIHPRALGHTILIPRRHAETIVDLSEKEVCLLFRSVRRVTALLRERLQPDGFTIGINHGKVSGQAIEHLHVHIIPRFKNDGGVSLHGVVRPPEGGFEQPLAEIRKKIVG